MEQSNKRIVKNTLYLYIRMLVMMLLSFFSTRIVLNILGVSDFGVNNVIGGLVAMFTLLNSILQTGTRRFLALNIGKEDALLLKRTFSTAFVIHCFIALFVVVLLETFGLWFLNTHLNIEPDRMRAANYVFQFSVVSLFLNITQTPFVAAVTAHEKFNIYAYLSIYDVVAKLAVLYILYVSPGDKLIVYAALIMGVNMFTIVLYRIYCIRQFAECKFSLSVDKVFIPADVFFFRLDNIRAFKCGIESARYYGFVKHLFQHSRQRSQRIGWNCVVGNRAICNGIYHGICSPTDKILWCRRTREFQKVDF